MPQPHSRNQRKTVSQRLARVATRQREPQRNGRPQDLPRTQRKTGSRASQDALPLGPSEWRTVSSSPRLSQDGHASAARRSSGGLSPGKPAARPSNPTQDGFATFTRTSDLPGREPSRRTGEIPVTGQVARPRPRSQELPLKDLQQTGQTQECPGYWRTLSPPHPTQGG